LEEFNDGGGLKTGASLLVSEGNLNIAVVSVVNSKAAEVSASDFFVAVCVDGNLVVGFHGAIISSSALFLGCLDVLN
jgi:hypothetical protein